MIVVLGMIVGCCNVVYKRLDISFVKLSNKNVYVWWCIDYSHWTLDLKITLEGIVKCGIKFEVNHFKKLLCTENGI